MFLPHYLFLLFFHLHILANHLFLHNRTFFLTKPVMFLPIPCIWLSIEENITTILNWIKAFYIILIRCLLQEFLSFVIFTDFKWWNFLSNRSSLSDWLDAYMLLWLSSSQIIYYPYLSSWNLLLFKIIVL